MPTYQYACTSCDHAFEQFQTFSEDSLTLCPECQGRLRKVFNAVGVVFKGSGFYRTDSRSEVKASSDNGSSSGDSASSNGSAKKESTSDSGSSEKKSDSATAKSTSAA